MRTGRTLLVVGLVLVLGASLWAPVQPELFTTGACQVAPCGTLEDPGRWGSAWVPWALGALAAVLGTALTARPAAAPRWPDVVLGLLLLPVLAVALLVVGVLVSWVTSVHGAASVVLAGLVLPLTAVVAGTVKGRRPHDDLHDSRVRSTVA